MTYIIIFLTVIVSIAALRNRTLFDRLSLVPVSYTHLTLPTNSLV